MLVRGGEVRRGEEAEVGASKLENKVRLWRVGIVLYSAEVLFSVGLIFVFTDVSVRLSGLAVAKEEDVGEGVLRKER